MKWASDAESSHRGLATGLTWQACDSGVICCQCPGGWQDHGDSTVEWRRHCWITLVYPCAGLPLETFTMEDRRHVRQFWRCHWYSLHLCIQTLPARKLLPLKKRICGDNRASQSWTSLAWWFRRLDLSIPASVCKYHRRQDKNLYAWLVY